MNPSDGVMAEIKKSKIWVKNKRHALTIPQQKAFMNFIEEKIKTVAAPFAFQVWLRFLRKNGRKIKILPK